MCSCRGGIPSDWPAGNLISAAMRHAFTRSTRSLSAAVSHALIRSTGIYTQYVFSSCGRPNMSISIVLLARLTRHCVHPCQI